MHEVDLKKFIAKHQLYQLAVLILSMFVFLALLLFGSIYYQAHTLAQEKTVFLVNCVETYFEKYIPRIERCNQNQAIRRLLSYYEETERHSNTMVEHLRAEIDLPPDMILFTNETQIWPLTKGGGVEAPSLQNGAAVAQLEDMLYFFVPYYNFVQTKQLGTLSFSISKESLISHINHTLPEEFQYEISDSSGCLIYSGKNTKDASDFLTVSETRTALAGQLHCKVYVELMSTFRSTATILIIYLLLCIIIYWITRCHSYQVASAISIPIHGLIRFLHVDHMHQFKGTALPRTGITEIDGLLSAYQQMVMQMSDLIEQNQKENLLRMESQLSALQQKINPHFLFNTLQIASSQAILEDAWKTQNTIQKLGALFRYNLRAPDVISIQQEVKCAQDYLYLQSLLCNETLIYHFTVDEMALSIQCPKLILQPLLENCIQHAFLEDAAHKKIEVCISLIRGQTLAISVSDNGKGFDSELADQIELEMELDKEHLSHFINRNEHIGLRNINARLSLFFHIHRAVFIKTNQTGGTIIQILLPTDPESGGTYV